MSYNSRIRPSRTEVRFTRWTFYGPLGPVGPVLRLRKGVNNVWRGSNMEIIDQFVSSAAPFAWLWNTKATRFLSQNPISKQTSELTLLPNELWARLLDFLTPAELGALASTSKPNLRLVRANTSALYMLEPMANQFSSAMRNYQNVGTLAIASPSDLGEREMHEMSLLKHLHTLRIFDTFMLSPQSLMKTLWNLRSLRELYLDFGDIATNFETDRDAWKESKASLRSLAGLTRLEKLTLLSIPPAWNVISFEALESLVHLRTLDLTYVVPPDTLDFLEPMKHLQNLALGLAEREVGRPGLALELPELPLLEHLEAIDFCFTPSSLSRQPRLRFLEFTPYGWLQEDLSAIRALENLRHASLHLTWLPNLRVVSNSLSHLTSLTLIEFDISRCVALCGLRNLAMLSLEYPTGHVTAGVTHFRPVALMLAEMRWLRAFRLIHFAHIPRSLAIAFAYDCPSLEHLEISVCPDCYAQLVDPGRITCITHKIRSFVVHCNGQILPYPESLVLLPTGDADLEQNLQDSRF